MANTILHKRSSTTGATPTAAQLSLGELALNTTDGKVFMEKGDGTVVEVSYRDDRVDSRMQTNLAAVSYSIIPAADITYDLGSPTHQWRDVYVGPGSLYVNGQKVLEEDSGNIIVSCDINQNLVFQTSGSGDIEIDPTGTGVIALKGPVQFEAGVNITTSDGNPVSFGNSIKVDSLTSKTSNTDLTLTGAGTGKVYINDNAEVSGNMVIGGNLTVSGTTTTVNSETISLADNIIDLNSNFTTGTPTENAGLRVLRGDDPAVQIRWNESSDVWQFTNDGSTYTAAVGTDATQTLTNKTFSLGSNTVTGTLAQFNTAVTDADFASLAGTETLTNKTIAAGSNTISGLTNANLSGTAGITNANLANSAVTIGSTSVSLGATATTLAGLTSVTSTGFTGALTGNADTATKWATARTITLGGDLSGSVSLDGSANVTLTATVASNTVALGTDTTGNYMVDVTAGSGISVTHTQGEGSTATVAIDSTVATLTGSQTLTNKTIALGSNTVSGTIAQFNTAVTDADLATLAGSETLTNKTLTAPNVSGLVITDGSITVEGATADAFETTLAFTDPTADRTITFPDLTGTVVTTGDTGTVTNTMLAGSIANAKLANSTISGKALGTNLDTLTISTGLSGTSYNGSGAVTIAIDSTVATLTGSQTLTNKTLTAPTINTPTVTGMILGDASIIFEGATADAFETTLTVTDPTADRTITFPDATGTVILSGSAASLSSVSTSGNIAAGGDLTVTGNLTVNGTTTTINSTTVAVDDKNLVLGDTASPTDASADGGGITLKGATDKTFNWVDATDAWTSSEHLNLASGKAFYINGTSVLSGSTLGSGVTASSLTSVGTITSGVWNGTAIANAYLANSTISGKALGTNLDTLSMGVSGTGLSGSTTYNGSGAATFTVTSNATSANTASTIVARDASGNFTAGTITAALTGNVTGNVSGSSGSCTGNASTATTLATARNIQGVSFNGSADITVVTAGTGVSVSGTAVSIGQAVATSSNVQFNSLGVGTAGSGTAGQIRATNEITAYYSDARLKENIKPIENALAKTLSLHGVTYNANDVAAGFGYTNKETQVGLLAQDVKAVLPEVVVPAPFDIKVVDGKEVSKSGEDYMTVKYEKIVALLVEAIKELNDKVESLEAQLGGSKSL